METVISQDNEQPFLAPSVSRREWFITHIFAEDMTQQQQENNELTNFIFVIDVFALDTLQDNAQNDANTVMEITTKQSAWNWNRDIKMEHRETTLLPAGPMSRDIRVNGTDNNLHMRSNHNR